MASIRKRGSNSYLIVVSRGYDYEGNRLKSVQKTVKPPKEYTHDIRMNCFPSSFSKYLVFKNLIPVPKTLLGSY